MFVFVIHQAFPLPSVLFQPILAPSSAQCISLESLLLLSPMVFKSHAAQKKDGAKYSGKDLTDGRSWNIQPLVNVSVSISRVAVATQINGLEVWEVLC